jgi:hypothetical protein
MGVARTHVSLCLCRVRAVKSAAQPAECKYTQCKTRYCGASMALKRFICLSAQTKLWCAHCVSLCSSQPRQTQLYHAVYYIMIVALPGQLEKCISFVGCERELFLFGPGRVFLVSCMLNFPCLGAPRPTPKNYYVYGHIWTLNLNSLLLSAVASKRPNT